MQCQVNNMYDTPEYKEKVYLDRIKYILESECRSNKEYVLIQNAIEEKTAHFRLNAFKRKRDLHEYYTENETWCRKYIIGMHVQCIDPRIEDNLLPSDFKDNEVIDVDIACEECFCSEYRMYNKSFKCTYCRITTQNDNVAISKTNEDWTQEEINKRNASIIKNIYNDRNQPGRKSLYTNKPWWLKSTFTGILYQKAH